VLGVEIVASLLLAGALPRAEVDRPDEVAGPQLHAVYAVPRNGEDRGFDTTGTIAGSVSAFQGWLAGETGGPVLRLDTFAGELDVTFVRLDRSDAELASRGAFVRDEIELELARRGLLVPTKLYAVYYDGSSNYSCGGGAWPPGLVGQVGAMYLKGAPPGSIPCATNRLAEGGGPPGFFEFGMLHELLHTLGFVAQCAPHHTRAGHASDNPNDLMWAGDAPWQLPPRLDIGRDDYYGHGSVDCPDLARSPYLTSSEPRLRVPSFHVGRARPGRELRVRMGVDVEGAAPRAAVVTCLARIGTRRLKVIGRSYALGSASCRWRVPGSARGMVQGSVVVTVANLTARRAFSARIR
jgi:hypothetical protein